jgi:hypothetical protein
MSSKSASRVDVRLERRATFVLPTFETVAETFARLERRKRLGWPGSVSIHGRFLTDRGYRKKDVE